jgi:para-nitrobenzyl esterase
LFALLDGGGFGMLDLPEGFGDGHVLPALDARAIFSDPANHNVVPVMLGTNRDEPTTFMVRDPRYVDTLLGLFSSLKDESAYRRTVHYAARGWKARGVDELAQHMTAAGNPNVYAYRFDWDEEPSLFGYDLATALGAGHGLEIAFVFGDFDGGLGLGYLYPDDAAQAALSNSMMSYWAEFAYAGDPGRGRDGAEQPWLAWGTNGKTSILLDSPADAGIRMDDEVVTHPAIKRELAADTTFADAAEHCATWVRLFRYGEYWDEDEYRTFANGRLSCSS